MMEFTVLSVKRFNGVETDNYSYLAVKNTSDCSRLKLLHNGYEKSNKAFNNLKVNKNCLKHCLIK